MKFTFIGLLMAGSIAFTACNNDNKTQQSSSTETNKDNTPATATTGDSKGEGVTASLKPVIDHYLHVKNALVNDNGAEAAAGGKALAEAVDKVDQSAFTPGQKKQYTEIAESLKEHAQHTAANAGKIDHQREHFIGMSEDVADLVKNFGADRTLYRANCPMANDKKGADWISETKEIRNPYMGKKMPECGSVKETINQ